MKAATCQCKAPVLKVLYDALELLLDPQRLTQLGEVDALLGGARTFVVYGTNVLRRTAAEITMFPAPIAGAVHREHKCGVVIPLPLVRKPKPISDEPGF